jgi:hypothetical protein
MDSAELCELSWLRRVVASGEAEKIRVAAGISMPEAAAAAGINVTTLWRWETSGPGHRRPHGRAALNYARVLRQLAKARAAS